MYAPKALTSPLSSVLSAAPFTNGSVPVSMATCGSGGTFPIGPDSVMPGKANPAAKPMQKRLYDASWGSEGVKPGFNLTSYSSAYAFDGTPKHQTGSGWGH